MGNLMPPRTFTCQCGIVQTIDRQVDGLCYTCHGTSEQWEQVRQRIRNTYGYETWWEADITPDFYAPSHYICTTGHASANDEGDVAVPMNRPLLWIELWQAAEALYHTRQHHHFIERVDIDLQGNLDFACGS